ncbi:oxygenase MpaB family protein [Nocardioides gilvus]|uniref:oxygenase MpaB family protein n=1 Tax=Nocardioides gilvus TaxID=1735589 RepID=UPI000D7478B1|nr:oxygenase MpaB family protein [Nocardioides gilvus]
MADGYFPEGSLLRSVQAHRAVGQTYGQRALILGATSPVPYVGTSSSTLAKERPFARLSATAEDFESIFFGDRDEADRVLAKVRRMHSHVKGELPRDEGPFPAGTRYDAFDPELMLWTMAVLADSSRVCFEALVRPLSPQEREELWQDWIRFGELFGMPRSVAPATVEDFDEWLAGKLNGPEFHVTDEARVVGRAIATDMPVPGRLRIGSRGTNLVVVGLLPDRVRRAFGLRWTPAHALLHRVLTGIVRTLLRVVPDRVRLGRNTRLFRIVTATEAKILADGGQTIVLPQIRTSQT